jgi:methionyl-tRNA synthetase
LGETTAGMAVDSWRRLGRIAASVGWTGRGGFCAATLMGSGAGAAGAGTGGVFTGGVGAGGPAEAAKKLANDPSGRCPWVFTGGGTVGGASRFMAGLGASFAGGSARPCAGLGRSKNRAGTHASGPASESSTMNDVVPPKSGRFDLLAADGGRFAVPRRSCPRGGSGEAGGAWAMWSFFLGAGATVPQDSERRGITVLVQAGPRLDFLGPQARLLKASVGWPQPRMSSSRPILVCVAWPYANGSLHLGHVAGSLLPPDIFARYQRAMGNKVLMVSGSDCHGTPIMVQAEKHGITPQALVEKFNAEHKASLKQLGVQFDLFTATNTPNHKKWVQDMFSVHKELGYLYEKEAMGTYCPKDQRFMPDRYVEGTCPHCGNPHARGDQCEKCGKTLDPQDLKDPRCKVCGGATEFRPTKHFYFTLSKFEPRLREWLKDKTWWRPNTINFTNNWLKEGLQDRPITRDLTWGIELPLKGYEDKRIYVWYEAVCGYLTASIEWAEKQGRPDAWKEWWLDEETKSFYFLGKDNIPFHTIIWPAMLMGYSEGLVKKKRIAHALNLPYNVPANEFLTLSGQQFSKSRGVGITLPDILSKFDPDTIRYYLSINMPEDKDADWSWDDFIAKINDELVGTFGNYIHRTLSFTQNHFGQIPQRGPLTQREQRLLDQISESTGYVGQFLEMCEFKKAIRAVMALAQAGNKYIDDVAPWSLIKKDKAACGTSLNVGIQLVKALAVLMQPFLPQATQRLWENLGEAGRVSEQPWGAGLDDVPAGRTLAPPKILFEKIDPKQVAEKAPEAGAKTEAKPMVPLEEFQKLDLRIGKVLSVENHPKADKLFVVKVDIGNGEARQLVAGMRAHYKPEELVGKHVALIVNLQPANIRGVESQGMLFGADDGNVVSVLLPDRKDLKVGAKIR